MQSKITHWLISSCAALVLNGCVAAEKTPATATASQAFVGWYMEHAGQGRFQPCGQSQQWRVSTAADLSTRAKEFGLQQDTPVYVRLIGSAHNEEIAVSHVEQFGSPTPVRDCAMTGVVIPAPSPARS